MTDTIFGRLELAVADDVYIRYCTEAEPIFWCTLLMHILSRCADFQYFNLSVFKNTEGVIRSRKSKGRRRIKLSKVGLWCLTPLSTIFQLNRGKKKQQQKTITKKQRMLRKH